MHPWMEKMPLNGKTCIAWILQGPLDLSSELNWALFYAGKDGIRDSFLNLWEFLASTAIPLCSPPCLQLHSKPHALQCTCVPAVHTLPCLLKTLDARHPDAFMQCRALASHLA